MLKIDDWWQSSLFSESSLQLGIRLEHVLKCDQALQDSVFVTHGYQNLATHINQHFLEFHLQLVLTQELISLYRGRH